jgi:hypothetical protein
MNPKMKLGALTLLLASITLWPASAKRNAAAQKAKPDYRPQLDAVAKQVNEKLRRVIDSV